MRKATAYPMGEYLYDICWRSDGKYMAVTCFENNRLEIFDEEINITKMRRIDTEKPKTCVFSPDNKYLVSNDGPDVIMIDNQMETIWKHPLECDIYVSSLIWAPDSTAIIAWGYTSNEIVMLNIKGEKIDSLEGISNKGSWGGRNLCWMKNKQGEDVLIVYRSDHGKLEFFKMLKKEEWEFANKEPFFRVDLPLRLDSEMLVAEDPSKLFIFDADGLRIVNTETGEVLTHQTVEYNSGRVALSPDKKKIVWPVSYQLAFYDFTKDKIFGTDQAGDFNNRSVSYHPSGEMLFIGDQEGKMHIYYLEEGCYLRSNPAPNYSGPPAPPELVSLANIKAEITGAQSAGVDFGIGGVLLGINRPPPQAEGAQEYRDIDISKNLKKLLGNKSKLAELRKLIIKFRPNVPVQLSRIVELAKLDKNTVEELLISLCEQKEDIGEYLALEQVFIRSNPEDKLLEEAFKEWEMKEQEKIGKA